METCMVLACHMPWQPLQSHPSGHLEDWQCLSRQWKCGWSHGQHQGVDVPAYARTAHSGLLQTRLEEYLCLIICHGLRQPIQSRDRTELMCYPGKGKNNTVRPDDWTVEVKEAGISVGLDVQNTIKCHSCPNGVLCPLWYSSSCDMSTQLLCQTEAISCNRQATALGFVIQSYWFSNCHPWNCVTHWLPLWCQMMSLK